MSTTFAHKPIVQDGLKFYFDPRNTKCYISGDTTANNLVLNGKNGTLTNGVGNTDNSWTVDGINDYLNIQTVSVPTTYTVTWWMKGTDTSAVVLSENDGCNFMGWLIGPTSVGTTNGSCSTTFFNTGVSFADNKWHEFTWVKNGATESLYFDGNFRQTLVHASNPGGRTFYRYGGRRPDGFWYSGELGPLLMYTRELTADEISQNYEVLRKTYK